MRPMAPTRDDVLQAAERIRGRVHRTPTFSSRTLGERRSLKAELFQKTGSFKARGVLNKLALSPERSERGVIGISAGNHAQALAWGRRWRDRLPRRDVREREPGEGGGDAGYGAAVDLEAADAVEAFDRLDEHIRQTGRTLVHPFDDPLVIAGQGTLALELLEDAPEVETIVVPVGGGGLVAGIAPPPPTGACRRRAGGLDRRARRARRRAAGPGDPRLDRRRALGAVRRGGGARVLRERGVESVLVSEEEIEDRVSLPLRAREARLRARRRGRRRRDPGGQGRRRGDRRCFSGGNVAAETASAILARR